MTKTDEERARIWDDLAHDRNKKPIRKPLHPKEPCPPKNDSPPPTTPKST